MKLFLGVCLLIGFGVWAFIPPHPSISEWILVAIFVLGWTMESMFVTLNRRMYKHNEEVEESIQKIREDVETIKWYASELHRGSKLQDTQEHL